MRGYAIGYDGLTVVMLFGFGYGFLAKNWLWFWLCSGYTCVTLGNIINFNLKIKCDKFC